MLARSGLLAAGREPIKKSRRAHRNMAAICQRLQCIQIPDIPIVSIGSDPVIYLAHMQSIIGKLQNKQSSSAANSAMHTFLKSPAGKSIQQGGDLGTAYLAGPLTAKIYTHRFVPNGANPSLVLTMEGVKDVVDILPDQDESAKSRIRSLLQEHLLDQATAKLCFRPAADDHCFTERDDRDGDITDVGAMAVTPYMWYNCTATNRVLTAQIDLKEDLFDAYKSTANAEKEAAVLKKELEHKEKEKHDAAALAAKDIALVKANAEKEALQKEIQHMREINELRMQLLRADGRANGDDQSKSHKKIKKIHVRDALFSELISAMWPQGTPGVDHFVAWPETDEPADAWPIYEGIFPLLAARMAEGHESISNGPEIKHRVFGFCYEGPAIDRRALRAARIIKEAYAVEVQGLHYVCIVLYNNASRVRDTIADILYTSKLLPIDIAPVQIPGGGNAISVYVPKVPTRDAVLEILKRPSDSKWCWDAAKK